MSTQRLMGQWISELDLACLKVYSASPPYFFNSKNRAFNVELGLNTTVHYRWQWLTLIHAAYFPDKKDCLPLGPSVCIKCGPRVTHREWNIDTSTIRVTEMTYSICNLVLDSCFLVHSNLWDTGGPQTGVLQTQDRIWIVKLCFMYKKNVMER